MKKSKVIVPALAMIGLSSVASITGSVAWFTANRTGTISTGDFVVTKTDGELNVNILENGVGTTRAKANPGDANYTVVNPMDGAKLTDASFNTKTKQLYTEANGATSIAAVGDQTSYTTTTDESHPYKFSATDKIYYAFTWQVQISMTGASSTNYAMNVFFDFDGSSMTPKKTDGSAAANQTSQGFRIAIINPTASKAIVYAGLKQDEADLKCVVNTVAGTAYTANTAFNGEFSYFAYDAYGFAGSAASSYDEGASKVPHAVDTAGSQTSLQSREDYLGNLTNAAQSMTLTCVAWFEGTDSLVVNGSILEQVRSTIAFYSTSYTVA